MKVGQKRVLSLLYVFGLIISLTLSFVSSSKQKEGITSVQNLINGHRKTELIQRQIDIYQNKVNIVTQGFLGKKDNWYRGYKELLTKQLSNENPSIESIELSQNYNRQINLLKEREKNRNFQKELINTLKIERRILLTKKTSIFKETLNLQDNVLTDLKSVSSLFTIYSAIMSGLFTLFIFLINLNKKNILALEASRKKREFMLESLDCAVLLLGKDKKILSSNKKCKQIWSIEELEDYSNLFSKVTIENNEGELEEIAFENNPLVLAIKRGSIEKGLTFHFNMRTLGLDPQWFQVDIKSFKEDLYLISLTNTTHLYEAKELIKKQQKTLIEQSKMSALGQMSGGMAHEINNPLAIISSEAEELLEIAEEDDGVAKDDATSISNNIKKTTERIAKIIRGLRIFSRAEENGEMENASLREIVDEVMVMTEERFKTKGVQFKKSIPDLEDVSAPIYCNPVQIIQVFVNLLNNSYDAVKELRERHVEFSWTELPDFHILIVKDNGPGIPSNIRDKIFDPFFTTKKVGEGTGLGLSLSRTIIEEHGGSLEYIEGEDGAKFQVKIPKIKEKENNNDDQQEEPWAS